MHNILTLSEVTELKAAVRSRFGTELHFHDCCGGQSFSVDKTDKEMRKFIADFFAAKKLNITFSDNGLQFSADAGKSKKNFTDAGEESK